MTDLSEKEHIAEHAEKRYLEAGISKVSVDEIAAELRLSKKTLYKFFPSKEELLGTVVRLMVGRVEKQVAALVASDKPFEQKMTNLLVIVGRMLGRMSRQFVKDMQRFAPELWREIETFRRERVLSHLNAMFTQAKEERIFRQDVDTELFYLVFITAVESIVNPQTLSEHSFSAKEAFNGILRLLIEGAITDEARTRIHLFEGESFA
jgi:AcrR family transcriptional regulator